MVSFTLKRKASAFSNFSGFKSVFEKLRFLEGLVWTEGLTVGNKAPFQKSFDLKSIFENIRFRDGLVT